MIVAITYVGDNIVGWLAVMKITSFIMLKQNV